MALFAFFKTLSSGDSAVYDGMTPEFVDEVETITQAMIHQAKLVQRNVAIIKNIGSLNTRYSIKMDTNLTLNNDNEYIMKITKSLRIGWTTFTKYFVDLKM